MSQRARRQIATQQAPADNLDLLASRVIKYLLEKSHKKYPVKASDIKKFVLDELWEFFMNLNIISEDESQHSYFGNVKSLISDKFVKQLYLIKSKQRETDSVLFEWGPRANYELDRKSVLKFVSKIYNCPMENFVKQYKAMKVYERSALRE
ncbi:hypothetical protein G9C98_008359 [Cotesia typhae]|uniref:MAGE domain-containing protein n=1 Tax=Cotesia typhae TaxID=2053667 RepID=A0A8J5QVT1_9HYME|nr:hypothetical protein G9C98_008359 [Cotesia typhae]